MVPPQTYDLRTSLESSLGGRYSIERELGGGGMARVFLATERALGRRVVIKVLSPELAAEVSSKRFEREIRLAASLQQANIVPVLSTGESDGVPHYTMPFVEGQSLRERLGRPDRPALAETVSILRDVARALAYAHERGVVHRDIKPENVLLSGDAAVVTDFGIAKAIASAKLGDGSGHRPPERTVTIAGTAVGTPAYMAPEQISADPSMDHRADIYAFGCLAYELIAGQVPFASSSTHGLFAAHLSEQPTPIFERNPAVPPALGALIMRCLEKDPVHRPQSAREILPVLESSTAQATGVRRLVQRLSRRQRRAGVGAVGVAATILVVAFARDALTGDDARDTPSVAVIPFLNTGGDSTHEYLADGMADGLATGLGKVPGITVVSRSLGYRYKGQRSLDVREVGLALQATYVLHGSIRRVGDRLRVSAQLTSAADNREVWAKSYDRHPADVLAVQDEIAQLVVSELPGSLARGDSSVIASVARIGTTNPDAYDLYLRGRFLLQRRAVRAAAEHFERSIQRDSNFAPAHASLALALELRPYFEPVNARTLGERAIAAAHRALRLDSMMAEAHTALAMAHQHRYEWQQAEDAYRRAMALNPNEPDAHIQFGRFLFYTGRGDAAAVAFERARALDPLSPVASGWVGHMHHLAGRHQQALVEIERAIGLDSNNAPSLVFYTQLLRSMGRTQEARAAAERLWNAVPAWRGPAAAALRDAGDSTRAAGMLRALEEGRGSDDPLPNYRRAMLYAAEKDTLRLLDRLERATANGEIWPTYISMSEHAFDFVRSHPRFAAVVRSVGLDDRIFTSPNGGRPR